MQHSEQHTTFDLFNPLRTTEDCLVRDVVSVEGDPAGGSSGTSPRPCIFVSPAKTDLIQFFDPKDHFHKQQGHLLSERKQTVQPDSGPNII